MGSDDADPTVVVTHEPVPLEVVGEASGTTLDIADGWCVAQVHVRDRLGADSSLAAIGRSFHVPAQVLEPAFHAARDNGYLTGEDDRLELTEQGHEEIHKVIAGTRARLASELSDWGADDDELLSKALTAMATRFVDEDADRRLEPAPAN